MKKFNFRLDSFLKIKQFEEKIAWNEVLKQEERVSKITHQIDTIHMQIKNAREIVSRTGGHQEGDSIVVADLHQQGIEALGWRIQDLQVMLKKEISLLQKVRDRHSEIKKETKSLESYKDKQKQEHKKENNKADVLRLSEVGSQRLARRKINE